MEVALARRPGPESGCAWRGVGWVGTTVNLSAETSVSLVGTDLRLYPCHRGTLWKLVCVDRGCGGVITRNVQHN